MTQTNQASIAASTLRSIDAGGFINTQLDTAATLLDSQHARILELEAELLTEKRHQRTRDVAAVRTLGALGFNWNGGDVWQAAPKAVCETEKEQIQALMDKHQIWIQQTRYEELDKPPYDLYAVQAEKHQFEAFVQDLIALYTIQPAAQGLDARPSIGTLWVEENGANDLELCPCSAPLLPGEYALFAVAAQEKQGSAQ